MSLDEDLISLNDIGLTNPVEEMVLITDEPKIPGYFCFLKKDIEDSLKINDIFGQGFDTNRTKAKIKSLGECLERFCLEKHFGNNLTVRKYDFQPGFLDPVLFCCYSEEQIEDRVSFIERVRKEKYIWWPVKDLNEKTIMIPAQLVFLSSEFNEEFPIRQERISTGAALGPFDNKHAFSAGFLEVVERDACISAYLTKRRIRKIVNLPDEIKRLVEYFQRYQLEPNIFDVTTDLKIPSVLVITIDDTGIGPAINTGSRSSLNYSRAIKDALLESIQSRRASRIKRKQNSEIERIQSIEDRFLFWSDKKKILDLNFWLNSSDKIDFDELNKQKIDFEDALAILQSKGYHIFTADITIPIIRDKGYKALKVIIPELHPLYLNEDAKALYSVHHGSIKEDKFLKPHPFM